MKWNYISESDRFIDSVILAVAEKEGNTYNPVYVHGNSYDVGAIMHRFENEYSRRNRGATICRMSGSDFYNRYIMGSNGADNADISGLCSRCDMLIFENIDAIAGNAILMQMFCRLFDSAYENGSKIIIGGLCHASSISALSNRVRTQLDCGIICSLAG